MTLKVCVAQLNFIVGDITGNSKKIIEAARSAYADGACLLLTSELSICGYAAEDLFLRPGFIAACDTAIETMASALADLKGFSVVVGHPTGGGNRTRSVAIPSRCNSASVLRDGQIVASYAKRQLPNYQVFDECRYFMPGSDVCVFEIRHGRDTVKVGLLICEDAWFEEPAQLARDAGAEMLAVINASPFHIGKGEEREGIMRERVLACGLPLVYAHMVGGQDELVFEGRSFVINADGSVAGRAASFKDELFVALISREQNTINFIANTHSQLTPDAELWHALVLGIKDYIGKNNFPGAVLGLSGGIDSALVLALAVDALGKDKVHTIMMPSPYTADISLIDAREMAFRMGVAHDEISIVSEFEAFKASLAHAFIGLPDDATEENIQARIRGTLLMALSNKLGHMVLTTGNKSELATGYCTLYGDMAGGFAAIKDLTKTTVFRLARWRNANDCYGSGTSPIPERIITRPPSAELRPDQTDQDSLPPYEILDAILERYMENDESTDDIIAAGFASSDVQCVTRLIKINEYKRRQAPIGIRVTHRSFGKDWRYPITNKFVA